MYKWVYKRMNVSNSCWEGLITHKEMWRRGSPEGKKSLLPSDLLRGCTLECIRWSRIAFPVLFFLPPPWPFVWGVCRCSGGHNIPIFISWFYSDAKARSQWTTPAPTALQAPHNACCSGSCILIHPHIGNHCLSHAEERQPFHSNPPSSPPQAQFPYVVARASECVITHLRRIAIDKTLRIK